MPGRSSKPQKSPYEQALSLLARREHSRRELAQKLERKGQAREAVVEALDQLLAEGYQSDERFGEMLVRSRISQCYGPVRIRAELRSHGLDDRLVEALLADAGQQTDWSKLAEAALHHRYGDAVSDDFVECSKHAGFLQRRGFPADIARRASSLD